MKYNKKISLVIPTLNEEKNLPLVFEEIPEYIDEIIIVDGYSKDSTVEIAKKYNCKIMKNPAAETAGYQNQNDLSCYSCENRNPGFPVKTGIQFLNSSPD